MGFTQLDRTDQGECRTVHKIYLNYVTRYSRRITFIHSDTEKDKVLGPYRTGHHMILRRYTVPDRLLDPLNFPPLSLNNPKI